MCVSLGQTPHLDTQKLSEPTLRPRYDSGTPFLRTLSLSFPLAATTVSTDHPHHPISLPCRPCIILPPYTLCPFLDCGSYWAPGFTRSSPSTAVGIFSH